MRHARRTSVAVFLVAAVTTAGVATATASTPRAAHASKVTGGSSSITLNKSALKALKKGGITLSAISPAKFNGKTLKAPVKSGSFSEIPPAATINTSGGFTISHKGSKVSVKGLKSTSDGSSGSGTAKVSGHGRIKAIITGMPSSFSLSGNPVTFSNFPVKLAKPLVKVLDKKFHTKLFKKHAAIGTGSASLKLKG